MTLRGRFLYVVLMVAMVMATVSPACAFVSGGKSWIQICGADGSIRQVEVPAAMDPFADPQPDTPQDHHQAQPDCAFCFAAADLHFLAGGYQQVSPAGVPDDLSFGLRAGAFVVLAQKPYEAHGPPALLS